MVSVPLDRDSDAAAQVDVANSGTLPIIPRIRADEEVAPALMTQNNTEQPEDVAACIRQNDEAQTFRVWSRSLAEILAVVRDLPINRRISPDDAIPGSLANSSIQQQNEVVPVLLQQNEAAWPAHAADRMQQNEDLHVDELMVPARLLPVFFALICIYAHCIASQPPAPGGNILAFPTPEEGPLSCLSRQIL